MDSQGMAPFMWRQVQPEAEVVRLAEVEECGVRWLWPGRIPLGKMSLLVGDPGLGKSLLALDLAARVSRGLPWPDGASGAAPLGRALVLSSEDDAGDTIRPRVAALGGDLMQVAVLRVSGHPSQQAAWKFSLTEHLPVIVDAILERGDVRLVVLDPLCSYLGGRGGAGNTGVRSALRHLQTLAEGSGAAVVGISHLNKRSGGAALHRAVDSLAYVAAPRAVWAVVADGGRPGRRLLLPLKSNLAAAPTGLAFRVVPSAASPQVPVVAWETGPVATSAEEALARQCVPKAREEAMRWLEALLAGGPLRCREVQRQAREVGFTPTAMRAAREALGVVTFRETYEGPWMLRMRDAERAEKASGLTVEASATARGALAPSDRTG